MLVTLPNMCAEVMQDEADVGGMWQLWPRKK